MLLKRLFEAMTGNLYGLDASSPYRLSNELAFVIERMTTGRRPPHWYTTPVESLISFLGDVPAAEVKPDDVLAWYDWLKARPSARDPTGALSPWTVDSYGRSVKAFFNHLVEAGHLPQSPARRLRLPRLPPKGKKEISPDDIEKMVRLSEASARDHALVLILRDSGCRVGELVTMQASGLILEDINGHLRGRALIYDDKTHTSRFIYFGHEACLALQRYLRTRLNGGERLWLTHAGEPITRSGIYQSLKRLGRRAGVEHFNPHAFRHALAKRLVNRGTPHKVLQDILGHADISTTLNMYVSYDDDELADQHQKYAGYG